MGALEIRCENGCSESVAAVVGALEGGGFVLEGGEGYDWAEDFFAVWKRGGFSEVSFFLFFGLFVCLVGMDKVGKDRGKMKDESETYKFSCHLEHW